MGNTEGTFSIFKLKASNFKKCLNDENVSFPTRPFLHRRVAQKIIEGKMTHLKDPHYYVRVKCA